MGPAKCRFPTSIAWARSLVFLSFFSRRTCDVVRSLGGTPLISIVYRCGVESWHPPIPRPFPPRTIAINTPPLPLRNHGTRRWWRSWRTDGSWANEHSRALNRTGVANRPPENETYFTLSTTKRNASSAHQTARVCTEACQMASRQPRQPSRAIRPVVGLRAFLGVALRIVGCKGGVECSSRHDLAQSLLGGCQGTVVGG